MKKLFFLVFFVCSFNVFAQQPFVTDNADVTDEGKFHFEFANQINALQRSAFPTKEQNSSLFGFYYGIFKNAEISFTSPLIVLVNDKNNPPHLIDGVGDSSLSFKYNFRKESESSKLPAMTVSASVQFPTGNSARSLGSGVRDYGFNFVAQKTYFEKYTFRANAGTILAGNTLNGVLGFKAHGVIFSGGTSVVRKINEKLQLGAELTGAVPNNFRLNAGQLQTQFGGNYQVRKNQTFDFGFIVGRFAASPRFGLQLGTSIDF